MGAQGWYRDPYRIHGDRWFSDGRPTRLVRDKGVESYDDPPLSEPTELLVAVPKRPRHKNDSKRADAATRVDQTLQSIWLFPARGIYWMRWNREQRGK
jgi:hypothetical protein